MSIYKLLYKEALLAKIDIRNGSPMVVEAPRK